MKQKELIKVTLLDNAIATLWYYPQLKVIHHKFHEGISGDRFREVLELGADLVSTEKCVKWLSDDRGNAALSAEDVLWVAGDWTTRMLDGGWKYWAILLPDLYLGKQSLMPIIHNYKKMGITVDVFEDAMSALTWLSSFPS